ncbi:MAG: M15 family metallopeptidase [Acidimicrobiia bacterium]
MAEKQLAAHARMLPALEQAARRIEASSADGDRYLSDGPSTYSAAARTIGGSFRVSRHIYGIAFDVNSRQNPFRGDNKLITNMPEWWVQDFLDAGFCWGGLWVGSKDVLHFAWQGPAFSDATFLPAPYEPLTDEAMFRDAVSAMNPNNGSTSLQFSGPNPFPGADQYFLGDSDLDYRPDLWAVHDGRVATALASDGYRSTAVSRRPSGLPNNLVDVRAADYDGDGRVDLITFDGFTKKVWLGNTPLSDGLPPEVWFEYEDPQCEDGEQTWYRQELRFTTSTWIAHGAYSWMKQYGFPSGCDPSKPECDAGPVTRQMFSEFLAWVDGLQPPAHVIRAAAWALDRAGLQIPCATSAADCWSEAMPRAELSSLFGQFLSTRRGDVPARDESLENKATRS